MTAGNQKLCVWAGLPMIVLWLVGFGLFAGFVPPPSPSDTAEEVVATYRDHTDLIRIGLVLSVIGAALLAPFIAVISVQIKRIEGRSSPLAYAQLALGALLPIVFIFPIMFMEAATFRLDRPVEDVQILNDVAWLMFIAVVTQTALELALIGVAILQDRRNEPVFPRWSGYYNLWVALLLMPGMATVFVKTGPLAWNGVLAWWIPLTAFASWLIVMTVLLLKAIDQETFEEAAAHHDADDGDLRAQVARLAADLDTLRAERDRTMTS